MLKLIFRAGINKILGRIANGEDLDLGLPCLPRPFLQANSVHNSSTFTVEIK